MDRTGDEHIRGTARDRCFGEKVREEETQFCLLTFLTFMPLSLISLMRFPGFVVASKWKVYWLAPAAAMGFTHCSGRDTIMCMSAATTTQH